MNGLSSQFKHRDAASYDAHAAAYHRHVDRLGAPLAKRICELAQIGQGDAVLDVGTGSGIAARRAAERVGPDGRAMGVDLSDGMVGQAAGLRPAAGAGPLEFRVMDAEDLDVSDAAVDRTICLCAVLHFPDIGAALGEMVRVTRPGGRIVVSYGSTRPLARPALARHVARRLTQHLRPTTKASLQGPRALLSWLPRFSIAEVPEVSPAWAESRPHRRITREMRRLGLVGVHTEWRGHELLYDSGAEFFEAQAAISTRIRKSFEAASTEQVSAARHAFIAHADSVLESGGSLRYPYGAVFMTAERPLA